MSTTPKRPSPADCRREVALASAASVPTPDQPPINFDRKARSELSLCEALEDAADTLPNICVGRYVRMAAALKALAGASDARALARRLPLTDAPEPTRRTLAAALALIGQEEREDRDLALELSEALDDAARSGGPENPTALGYLLRNYFENRRRHLAWRREALVAPARRMLSPDDAAIFLAPLETDGADLRIITLASGSA